jgi:hypothetical protein
MSAHTPGPWKVSDLSKSAGRYLLVYQDAEVNEESGPIARVFPAKGRDANARLIAAAPALLEALEKLTAELSSVQLEAVREGCGNTNAACLTLRVDEARAAIRAAKGESNE